LHPQYQLWEKHFLWNADGTTILDLTPIGQATIAALRMNRPAFVSIVTPMWEMRHGA
jgi:hypothetical protein